MSTRPRTRDHFPRMKVCGHRRLENLRVDIMLAFMRMGSDFSAVKATLGEVATALGSLEARMATMVPEIPISLVLVAAAAPYPEVDLSGYVIDDPFDPEPDPCSLCDDHVHDITNTACVCCMVHAPDPASTRRAPADLLTLQCMAAEHDHCEGDFCECACHDTTKEG